MDGFKIPSIPGMLGVEADDLVATLAAKAPVIWVVAISWDKDLYQVLDDRTFLAVRRGGKSKLYRARLYLDATAGSTRRVLPREMEAPMRLRRFGWMATEREPGRGSWRCAVEILASWDAGGAVGQVVKIIGLDRDLNRCSGRTTIWQEADVVPVGASEAAAISRSFWPRRTGR